MFSRFAAAAVIGLFVSSFSLAQYQQICPTFSSSNPATSNDVIGADMDSTAFYTIVSNPSHDNFDGEVYIYQIVNNQVSLYQRITAPANARFFGASVAIDGDVAVIGAPAETGGGAVYVYHNTGSGFVQKARLQPGTLSSNADFGDTVEINDNMILVDAPRDDQVYAFQTYVSPFSLSVYQRQVFNYPGSLLGIEDLYFANDRAFLAGPINASFEGAVYIMKMSGTFNFTLDQTLTGYTSGETFGADIGVDDDGDYLAVGAPRYLDGTDETGGVYIYRWNYSSYILEQVLVGSDSADGDLFGIEVDLTSQGTTVRVLASAFNRNTTYSYQIISGTPYETKLTGGNGGISFGFNVCLQGSARYIVESSGLCWGGSGYVTTGKIYFLP
ncbi:MAG: FG-GAP repeat protein [Acidobacteriota bacterium]|nr:FG-GAP repeat protein [Acidobacteriota bacterium]